MTQFRFPALFALLALVAGSSYGGELTVKFVLDGAAPKASALDVSKEAFCTKVDPPLVDERIVAGKGGELSNVVMYLLPAIGSKVPVPADVLSGLPKEVVLDNAKCRFEPHVTVLHTSQTLVIGNKDPFGHNAKLDLFANGPDNPLIPAGGAVKKALPKAEKIPGNISCSIHPWMQGVLLVRDDPYFGVSGADGVLKISKIPAGKWTFVAWHEKAGFLVVKDNAGKTWTRGRIELDCSKDVDLGSIKVPVALLSK